MKGDENVRLGILGTGVVGKTIAARLAGLGHEVMVGTRHPPVLVTWSSTSSSFQSRSGTLYLVRLTIELEEDPPAMIQP